MHHRRDENAALGGAAQSNFGGTGNSARRVAKPVVAQTLEEALDSFPLAQKRPPVNTLLAA
jgi:hypothetical protein